MTRTIQEPALTSRPFLRGVTMLVVTLLVTISAALAQTTWNGVADTDWNNAANWSNGVPGADQRVTIADGPNDPVISGTTSAVAFSVLVQATANLTVQASGSLTVSGYAAHTSPTNFTAAINNLGTVTNSGSIVVGSPDFPGTHGIVNQQIFNNAVGGSIDVGSWINTGIYNAAGTFNNDGGIVIANKVNIGQHGIWNDGMFQNNSAGTINIDRVSLIGLMNNFNPATGNATFNNSGDITIGGMVSVGNYGLENLGDFNNASGGNLSIDRSSHAGLYNAAGSFTNGGAVAIGGITAVGANGVQNDATMTISECGQLLVLSGNLSGSADKTINNAGFVLVKNDLASIGLFTNNGVLKYGSFSQPFLNQSLAVKDAVTPFFTYGDNFTGTINGIFTDTAATQPAGTFTAPDQFVPEGLDEGSHTLYARITPQSGSCSYIVPFTYIYTAPGPDINIKGNGYDISNGENNPLFTKFTNFGSVYALSGNTVRSFAIENKGDQPLGLTGTPLVSLSGSPDFAVTSQPASTLAAGEVTPFEITFDPSSTGVKTAIVSIANDDSNENPYTFTIAGEGNDICVPVASTAPLTWTGLIDTDWNTPCNWLPASVPTQANEVVIPATGNSPMIGAGIAAVAKTVEVKTGATLTIAAAASLSVKEAKTFSGAETVFYNAGSVQNNGELTLGATSFTADHGLVNAGQFTNGNCAKVNVLSGDLKNDLSKTFTNAGLAYTANALTNDGIFTNDGVLKYGSVTGTVTNNQIIVHDKPTPIFSLGGDFSGTIDGIFKDDNATQSAGTFTAPDQFSPDLSLSVGDHTLYAKISPAGGSCTFIVPFKYEFVTGVATWTGNVSSDWNNAGNWTPGVPETYTEALIPDVSANDPVIGNGQSVGVYSVRIETGGALSISSGAVLTINGFSDYTSPFNFTAGFNNKGTVNNSGQLILGSESGAGSYAIVNQEVFNNLTGAEIRIDNTSDTGLFNAAGTFTNHANITIGANGAVGLHGIWNDAVFNNNTGGNISIARSSAKALMNNSDETKSIHATFTNAAAITIGAAASAGINGIHNMAKFNNNPGGDIHVDNTTNTAIYNDKDTFTNAASIAIGSVAQAGNTGLDSYGDFVNKVGASLKVDRTLNLGINIGADTLTNDGSIILGAVSKPGNIGLRTANATLINTGAVSVDRTFTTGIESKGNTVNSGTITIGGLEEVGRFGLFVSGSFTNNAGGVIRIDRVVGPPAGLATGLRHEGGSFDNSGAIVIGEAVSGGEYGMRLQASFLNNTGGTISIDRTSMTAIDNATAFANKSGITIGALALVGKYGIDSKGTFSNDAGGNIKIDNTTGAAVYAKSTFNNSGDLNIGASSAVGRFGIETGGSANFTNASGGNIAIDRASSIAIAHLGGTFDNAAGITIGGVADAGTYGISNQTTFKNSTGGSIRIDRTSDTGIYQLEGTFTNEADITIGANAGVGVHGIFNETIFDNNAGGNIRIDGTSLAGLRVFNGTFTNDANLTIGSAGSVGTYGIQNQSFLVNKAGGDIRIDRATDTGIYQFKGILTNGGAITIGANANVGVHGIFNESGFKNDAGGDIRIDRTTLAALRNFNGTFTNAASITIGSLASVGTYGIRNQAAFANNAGGSIKVDNATQGIFLEDNTFNNAGQLTIGGVSAIANLLTQQGTGVFSNNTGGVIKGMGQIVASALTNAGGTLAPGYSPGNLTFNDSEDFTNSIMEIEVNGISTPGVDFDHISVTGTATLGGTLAVTVNYTPTIGDEMTILTATSVTGTFGTVTGLAIGWKVLYESNAVKLHYDDPMPVTLVWFNAKVAGPIVKLDWRTASETDNAGFFIERSANGFKWEDIGFVDGNATTSVVKDYTFRDEKPAAGLNYYRLRQVDFDGKTERSRVAAVRFLDLENSVTVWADASRQAYIKSAEPIEQVTVYDLSGRVLLVSQESALNLSHMPSGIVLVRVVTAGGVVVKRIALF